MAEANTPTWHYTQLPSGTSEKGSEYGEFFSNDTKLDYVVRESIQNSLDAKNGDGSVRVRFYYSGKGQYALSGSDYAPYRGVEAEKRYRDENSGLKRPIPEITESCPYLVIEDFGTTGLTGYVDRCPLRKDRRNVRLWNYYNFFYREGISCKEDEVDEDGVLKTRLGSWGTGKCIYMKASRLKTAFALSVRGEDETPRELLSGMMTMRIMQDDEGWKWSSDCHFGIENSAEKTPLTQAFLPVSDGAALSVFRKNFRLKRISEQGTSVVIPYVSFDQNQNADTDENDVQEFIIRTVIRNFLPRLMSGELEVIVAAGKGSDEITISKGTLDRLSAQYLPPESTAVRQVMMTQLHYNLAKLYVKGKVETIDLQIPEDACAPFSAEKLLAGNELKELKRKLTSGRPILFKVPIPITFLKHDDPSVTILRQGQFEVLVQRAQLKKNQKPLFFRQGLLVPDVKRVTPLTSYLSFVFISDNAVARMLVASENPSHTEWRENAERIGEIVRNPARHIDYVRRSVEEIVRFIAASDRQADEHVLVDIFGVDPDKEGNDRGSNPPPRKHSPGNQNGEIEPTPPQPTPPLPPPEFPKVTHEIITAAPYGMRLSVAAGQSYTAAHPFTIRTKVGYVDDKGDIDWDPEDFKLDDPKSEIKVTMTSDSERGVAEILPLKDNQVMIRVNKPGYFAVEIRGFDGRDCDHSSISYGGEQ